MPVTCPAGHTSESADYCDTCGSPIEGAAPGPGATAGGPAVPAASGGAAAPPANTAQIPAATSATPATPCPNCGAPAGPDDAFCEVCGIDFATGELPAKPPPSSDPGAAAAATTGAATGATTEATSEQWVAVIEPDREFYEGNRNPDVPVAFPDDLGPRQVPLTTDEVLIGRRSDTKGIFPDIDLGPEDPGVSRRHAVLRRRPDGSWVVIDQGSTNGTRVGGIRTPIPVGEERILLSGDHLLVGAWTRITLKRSAASA